MKKLLLSTIFLLGAGMAQAQLSVNYDGYTSVKRLNVNTAGTSDDLGIYMYINTHSMSYTGMHTEIAGYTGDSYNYRYGIAIKGISKKCVDGNYGIYGYVPTTTGNIYNYGAAIYGTNSSTRKVLNGLYAGFFDGLVGVCGSIFATGTIQGNHVVTALPNPITQEVSLLSRGSNNITSQLSGIQAGSFYVNPPSLYSASRAFDENDSTELSSETNRDIAVADVSRKHYGLSADQLEEVFPDLVYENEDGTKSINYVEMVPILVQAINELSAKVTALEGGSSSARKVVTNVDGIGEGVQVLSLGQNRPNPFGTTTDIEVSVPENVQSAFVYVYDLQGKEVQQVDITGRGKQNVQLNAAELVDGMYLYSLIADGQVVETRRMIVKK